MTAPAGPGGETGPTAGDGVGESEAAEAAAVVEGPEAEPAGDEAVGAVEGVGGVEGTGTAGGRRRWRPGLPVAGRGRLAGVALLLVLAVGLGGLVWWRAGVLPDGVAFAVRDQEVTVVQLDRQAETLQALYGVRPPTDAAGLDRFRRDLAQASAVGTVVEQAAAQRGLAVPEKVARDTLASYVEQFFGTGAAARDQFARALATVGTAEGDVVAEIERQLLVRRLFEEVTRDVAVTPDEVRAAFEQRRDELALPERRELRNIVVASKEEADEVVAELAGGADFVTVAAARSADESTRAQGGVLGTLARGQLEPAYGDAAFAVAPGALFGPVQTRFGWNVGVVGQVLSPQPAAFEQAEETLTAAVRLEKATGVWREFLSAEIAAADVRYADPYRPADPGALPPDPDPGQGLPGPAAPPR